MSAFPYMRFFVGDYLGDTRHLSTQEHGAYLLIIMAYWQRGEALPNRDADLARIAGVSRGTWARMKDTVLAFFEVSPVKIVHHRIEREIEHMLAKSLKAGKAGRASVERRLNKRSTKPDARHQIPVKESPSEPPSSAPDKSGSDAHEEDEIEVEPAEHYTAAFEAWWAIYPNKTGKRAAAQSYDRAFKRLGGAKVGTGKVHRKLLDGITAQVIVWKRKGVEGRFIPHAATWLNQSRWDDAAVQAELARADEPAIEAEPVELAPADPKPEARCRYCGMEAPQHTVDCVRPRPKRGWTPEDEKVS